MTEKMTKTFIAEEIDQEIISKKAASMGSTSDSAAIRAIIREWDAMTKRTLFTTITPPAPKQEA